MTLVLEVEFLTGVCRAARSPAHRLPDWPPQPDRMFSALASAWGVRGQDPIEQAALEWLEAQSPPVIHASKHSNRTSPEVFVPPNDPKASTTDKTYLRVLPENRRRQPRRFPAARPVDPVLKLVWPNAPSVATIDALNAIACCVGYVGHSTSLTRCRFFSGDDANPEPKPIPARRWVYPGRLRELQEAHYARPSRPVVRPGAPVYRVPEPPSEPPQDWLVLKVVGGEVPDIRALVLVIRLLRQTLMAGYRRIGLGDNIPEIVSGHSRDKTPSRNPHLSIVPLSNVAHPYADGHVTGFALIPPPGVELLQLDGFRTAFEAVAHYRESEQRRVLTLQGPPLRSSMHLSPTLRQEGELKSLNLEPYSSGSSRWASVTPILLDRHLKRRDDSEVQQLVSRACELAGLPRPNPDRIQVGKHSAFQGAPPSRPSPGEPPWTRWKLPESLASRQLVHAVIDFDRKVYGPVLLGAGRFTGLGFCRSFGK